MKRVVSLCFLFFAVANVNAQNLTLDEAINIALKNSLDIEIAQNTYEANRINNHLAMAGGLPEVSGSLTDNQSLTNLNQKLSNGTTTKRNGNSNNALNAGIEASFLLYNGNRVRYTKSRLGAIERQSAEDINLQIQNLVASVMIKYYDIIRQAGYVTTIQQSIDVTLQRKKLIDARQEVGLANNADSYQARLDLTAAQQELRSQALILDQAKADLLSLLTLRPDSAITVRDTIIVDRNVSIAAVRENLRNNPAFLAADQQILINELIEKEIGARRYPSVSLNGGYNYVRSQNAAGFTLLNQNFGPFIGFGLQIPIFNGGVTRRQQQIAAIDTRNAERVRQTVLNDLESQAVKAWMSYQNSLERLEAEKENNRIAADLLTLVQQRFQLGVGTTVDLREAQRSFVEAGFRLVNLSYAAKVAEVELKRLSGQLPLRVQ